MLKKTTGGGPVSYVPGTTSGVHVQMDTFISYVDFFLGGGRLIVDERELLSGIIIRRI